MLRIDLLVWKLLGSNYTSSSLAMSCLINSIHLYLPMDPNPQPLHLLKRTWFCNYIASSIFICPNWACLFYMRLEKRKGKYLKSERCQIKNVIVDLVSRPRLLNTLRDSEWRIQTANVTPTVAQLFLHFKSIIYDSRESLIPLRNLAQFRGQVQGKFCFKAAQNLLRSVSS